MRYLHAIYDPATPDHLVFFGEDYTRHIPKKRGRKSKTIQESPHPHGMTGEDLKCLLYPSDPAIHPNISSVSVSLPVSGNTLLTPDDPAVEGDISFLPFQYPALAVPVEMLPSILPGLGTTAYDSIVLSDSIRYYQTVLAFALESISRECFLPEVSDTAPTGRWTGFFGPDDRERLSHLTQSMPGICFSFSKQTHAPDTLLIRFINDCINGIVKSALKESPSPVHGRARSGKNPAAMWMLSLWGEQVPSPIFPDKNGGKEAADWISEPRKSSGSRPFYTCLRLVEPSEASSDFQVQSI